VSLKVCSNCQEEKRISEFYKQKNGKFGVTAECKICRVVRDRLYHETHPEIRKKSDKKKQDNKNFKLKSQFS
jgi:hypothetical protein